MRRRFMYMLDGAGEPVPVENAEVWGAWFQRSSLDRTRIIQQDYAEGSDQTVGVSTVFLGLDHNFAMTGPPVLWETLVFGTTLDGRMDRYSSRDAALAGHARMLDQVSDAWNRERGGES